MEEEFDEIYQEANKRCREFSRGYVCQDINIRHGVDYWVYVVTKERMGK